MEILEALDIAHKAVEAASEKQASDIVLLDTQGICSFADYFVICTGESGRQMAAISDTIEETLRKEKVRPLRQEGTITSGWILLDYGSVVIHLFDQTRRDYYQLDKFWEKSCTLVRIQ